MEEFNHTSSATYLQKLQLNKVLDDEFDVHNTPIEELSVPQLRYECEKRRLEDKGLKVIIFCSEVWTIIHCKERTARVHLPVMNRSELRDPLGAVWMAFWLTQHNFYSVHKL